MSDDDLAALIADRFKLQPAGYLCADRLGRLSVRQRAPKAGGATRLFVHDETGQQFSLVPRTRFAMGLTPAQLVEALREVRYVPELAFWREAHAHTFALAQPSRVVEVPAFLIGRTPLLGGLVNAADATISRWTFDEQRARDQDVVVLTKPEADRVLERHAWSLPTEVQWECAASCAGADLFAGGAAYARHVDALLESSRFEGGARHCNAFGLWALSLGEWLADRWLADGASPATGGHTSVDDEVGSSVRGGGVRHAPWQDGDEATSCLAAARVGPNPASSSRHGARPVIALEEGAATVVETAPVVAFDDAVHEYEREIVAERERRAAAERSRREAHKAAVRDLAENIQEATVRSIGAPGTYVVRMGAANGLLTVPEGGPALAVGQAIRVRVVGVERLPRVELVP